MKKLVIISGLVVGLLTGCGDGPQKTITEDFKIINVSDENVRGELLKGTGEGIYYPKDILKDAGLKDDLKVGDKISITWTEDDYETSNWDSIYSVDKMD